MKVWTSWQYYWQIGVKNWSESYDYLHLLEWISTYAHTQTQTPIHTSGCSCLLDLSQEECETSTLEKFDHFAPEQKNLDLI